MCATPSLSKNQTLFQLCRQVFQQHFRTFAEPAEREQEALQEARLNDSSNADG